MPYPLRYATANQIVPLGAFLDSADGNTPENALTIANTDIKLWKAGATALVNKNSGGATLMSDAHYYATFDATDSNTVGPLKIITHPTGALEVEMMCFVYPDEVYDALFAGSGVLEVDVVKWLGVSAPANSGDSFARLGAPAGASISADIAATKAAIGSGGSGYTPGSVAWQVGPFKRPDGSAISRLEVVAYTDAAALASDVQAGLTDDFGMVVLMLDPGTYYLRAKSEGFYTQVIQITVTGA